MDKTAGVVIYNPTAGRGHAARAILRAKQCLGSEWEWRATTHAGHALTLSQDAAREGCRVVAACGGDGTVNDVARGLLGTSSILGILPAGTGNDMARNLGLPLKDMAAACKLLQTGRVQLIDTGAINDIPFVNNAGLGFDACVMETMNQSIRFVRGMPAFLLAILKVFVYFRPFELVYQKDDDPPISTKAMMLSILNGPYYGSGIHACPGARVDDGELDVLIVQAMPKLRLLALLPRVMMGRHQWHPGVSLFRTRRISLQCRPEQSLNVNGDVLGVTPAEIVVQPNSLRVLVP